MNKQSGSLETRTAIVVGGSLGGLTAAALLKREGWAVTVFERSHMMLDGAGAGIVVHDSTVRHLVDHRGLNIDDFTCTAEIARVYGPGDEILFEEPSDYRFTSWTTLYRHLVDSVGRDNYRLNELMVALDQDEAGARVTFASGRTVEADLVVCADGIGSAARTLLFGEVKRNYAAMSDGEESSRLTNLGPVPLRAAGLHHLWHCSQQPHRLLPDPGSRGPVDEPLGQLRLVPQRRGRGPCRADDGV